MRLAEFILANIEPILIEWEAFARRIWPGTMAASPAELRDDAEAILRATVLDMRSEQTPEEQSEKSKGEDDAEGNPITQASESHGGGRAVSGFDMGGVVAEYRALRASVLRLWRESNPKPNLSDLNDLTRFNAAIDQSLAASVASFAKQIEADRSDIVRRELLARKEAEKANRAKDMFLATFSHELRTPLSAIIGWLSILRSKRCSAEDLKEGLEVIQRNADAQIGLIADVLDVSRIVAGKLRLEIRPCDLIQSIKAGVLAVRPAAEARGITLDLHLDPAASAASCDAVRIQQVVWNLVSNAVKFTPKGGRIDVTLERDQSHLQISVSDTGQGISPELLPFVFEPFRQADSSTRRRFGGLGLGLSIVKHLVEGHGGTVAAESAGEGKGSRFTVRLPVRAVPIDEDSQSKEATQPGRAQSANGKTKAKSSEPPALLKGLHVLVVDDESDARRILLRLLQNAGATVTTAASAREALALLAEIRPRVLLSDIGMPDEDGYWLIRQIRAGGHTPETLPAIALTAYAQHGAERLALEAGFQVHISKPVTPRDLTVAIARLVDRTH